MKGLKAGRGEERECEGMEGGRKEAERMAL